MDLFDMYGSRSDHDDDNDNVAEVGKTQQEPGPDEATTSSTESRPQALEAGQDDDDSQSWPTDELQPVAGEPNEEIPEQPGEFDRLRPYARTGGRTQSDVPLAVESLIVALPVSAERSAQLPTEHAQLQRLCAARNTSVAEIAAHLRLPIGVTKVIISDAIHNALVRQVSDDVVTDRPSLDLMHRVLEGLERI